MRRTGWIRWLLPLLILGSVAGCDILSPEEEGWGKIAGELTRNRLKWERAGIRDYTFTTHSTCECIPNFEGRTLVTVEGSEIVGVERVFDGSEVDTELWAAWETIDEVFEVLSGYIERKVFFLEVEYDPEYGYPVWYDVDVNEQYVDDERRQDFSNFLVTGG